MPTAQQERRRQKQQATIDEMTAGSNTVDLDALADQIAGKQPAATPAPVAAPVPTPPMPVAGGGVDLDALADQIAGRPAAVSVRERPNLAGMHPNARQSLQTALGELDKSGVKYSIGSAFRSSADQAALYARRNTNKFPVAPPGHSAHEQGTAVDITFPAGQEQGAALLSKHGWTWAGAKDRVHFTFGGAAQTTPTGMAPPVLPPANGVPRTQPQPTSAPARTTRERGSSSSLPPRPMTFARSREETALAQAEREWANRPPIAKAPGHKAAEFGPIREMAARRESALLNLGHALPRIQKEAEAQFAHLKAEEQSLTAGRKAVGRGELSPAGVASLARRIDAYSVNADAFTARIKELARYGKRAEIVRSRYIKTDSKGRVVDVRPPHTGMQYPQEVAAEKPGVAQRMVTETAGRVAGFFAPATAGNEKGLQQARASLMLQGAYPPLPPLPGKTPAERERQIREKNAVLDFVRQEALNETANPRFRASFERQGTQGFSPWQRQLLPVIRKQWAAENEARVRSNQAGAILTDLAAQMAGAKAAGVTGSIITKGLTKRLEPLLISPALRGLAGEATATGLPQIGRTWARDLTLRAIPPIVGSAAAGTAFSGTAAGITTLGTGGTPKQAVEAAGHALLLGAVIGAAFGTLPYVGALFRSQWNSKTTPAQIRTMMDWGADNLGLDAAERTQFGRRLVQVAKAPLIRKAGLWRKIEQDFAARAEAAAPAAAAEHPLVRMRQTPPAEVAQIAQSGGSEAPAAVENLQQHMARKAAISVPIPDHPEAIADWHREWPKSDASKHVGNLTAAATRLRAENPALAQQLGDAAEEMRGEWNRQFAAVRVSPEEAASLPPPAPPAQVSLWRRLTPDDRKVLSHNERQALLLQDVSNSNQTLNPEAPPVTSMKDAGNFRSVAALEAYANAQYQDAQAKVASEVAPPPIAEPGIAETQSAEAIPPPVVPAAEPLIAPVAPETAAIPPQSSDLPVTPPVAATGAPVPAAPTTGAEDFPALLREVGSHGLPPDAAMKLIREGAEPVTDISAERNPTGWLMVRRGRNAANRDTVYLVHPEENLIIPFRTDQPDSTNNPRPGMEAQAYAIDNPVESKPIEPTGKIKIEPIYRQPEAPAPTVERRVNPEQRKRIEEITDPEELRREAMRYREQALLHPRSGFAGPLAYREAPKKPWQAEVDADSLKWWNDEFKEEAGEAGGDALIQAIGRTLNAEGLETYHIGGDEFVAQGATREELQAGLERVNETLGKAIIEFQTNDGRTRRFTGAQVSYGIGETIQGERPYGRATSELDRAKQEREAAGLRAGRFSRPPGVAEVGEGGRQPQGQQKLEGAPAGRSGLRGSAEGVVAPAQPPIGRRGAPAIKAAIGQVGKAGAAKVRAAAPPTPAEAKPATEPKPKPALVKAPAANVEMPPERPKFAPGGKPLWEMSLEELDAAHAAAKTDDRALLDRLFGIEGAKRYRGLQRKANSDFTSYAEIEQLSKQIEQMEATLSKAEQDQLFGVGAADTELPELLAEYRTALGSLDADSAEGLGDSLKWAITNVGKETDPTQMTHEQQVAYAQLRYGMRIAAQEGFDTAVVTKAAIQGAAGRWRDPADAAYMLSRFINERPSAEAQGTPSLPSQRAEPKALPPAKQQAPREQQQARKPEWVTGNDKFDTFTRETEFPPEESALEKQKAGWERFRNAVSRSYEHLGDRSQYATVMEALDWFKQSAGLAEGTLFRLQREYYRGLSNTEYQIARRAILLRNWEEEIGLQRQAWIDAGGDPATFEPRLSREFTEAEVADLRKAVEPKVTPKIEAAITKRQVGNKKVLDTLFTSREQVTGEAPTPLKRQDWFHHMVLLYNEGKRTGAAGKIGKIPGTLNALRKRTGSTLDVVSGLLASEADWLPAAVKQAKLYDFIKLVEDEHDVSRDVFWDTMVANDPAMEGAWSDLAAGTANVEALVNSKIGALAEEGMLPDTLAKRWAPLIHALRSHHAQPLAGPVDPAILTDLPEYARWLNTPRGIPGAKGVTAMRSAARAQAFKAALGKATVRPEQMLGQARYANHLAWSPPKGHILNVTRSLPEHMIDQTLQALGGLLKVDTTKARAALFQGMMIPRELGETLNLLGNSRADDFHQHVERGLRMVMTGWKWHRLISPFTAIPYWTNNARSGFNALLRSNAKALTPQIALRAAGEMMRATTTGVVKSPELEDWLSRGGLVSLYESRETGIYGGFAPLAGFRERGGAKALIAQNLRSAAQWPHVTRESAERYGSYLAFLEDLRKNGRPTNFAASDRGEVLALKTPEAQAWRLSQDLSVDYARTSEFGTWLADHLMPFFRYQEGNYRREKQLWRNAMTDPNLTAAVGKRYAGVGAGAARVRQIGRLVLGMLGMELFAYGYNHLRHPEEEEQLDSRTRGRPHLIVGRAPNGDIRYIDFFGNFTDLVGWAGLDNTMGYWEAYLNGRMTPGEIGKDMAKSFVNRFVSQVSPVYKAPVEFATKRSLFPDATKPRPVKDRWEPIFDQMNAGWAWRLMQGRPLREDRWLGAARAPYKTVDPDEATFYEMKTFAREWLAREDPNKSRDLSDSGDTPRSNALYLWREAERLGDHEMATQRLAEYVHTKGTREGFVTSLLRSEPLHDLNSDQEKKILEGMTPETQEQMRRAYFYWQRFIAPGSEPIFAPMDLPRFVRETRREVTKWAKKHNPLREMLKEDPALKHEYRRNEREKAHVRPER